MQNIMGKKALLRVTLYFLFFLLPILGMSNCSGWSSRDMEVASCAIDFGLARSYANLYYDFVFISAFLIFVPVLVYIVLAIAACEILVWITSRFLLK